MNELAREKGSAQVCQEQRGKWVVRMWDSAAAGWGPGFLNKAVFEGLHPHGKSRLEKTLIHWHVDTKKNLYASAWVGKMSIWETKSPGLSLPQIWRFIFADDPGTMTINDLQEDQWPKGWSRNGDVSVLCGKCKTALEGMFFSGMLPENRLLYRWAHKQKWWQVGGQNPPWEPADAIAPKDSLKLHITGWQSERERKITMFKIVKGLKDVIKTLRKEQVLWKTLLHDSYEHSIWSSTG